MVLGRIFDLIDLSRNHNLDKKQEQSYARSVKRFFVSNVSRLFSKSRWKSRDKHFPWLFFCIKEGITEMRLNGKVKWFSNKLGYGFIKQDTGEEIFVHYSMI